MENKNLINYENCSLCGRNCRINRKLTAGYCQAGAQILMSSYLSHFGEEPPISGVRGSGTVFFAGCSLGCAFCQNYQISSELFGKVVSESQLADIFLELQFQGVHNINLVTPTHFTPSIKKSVESAKIRGLKIPVVYNSSGYDSLSNLEYIDEIIDIYLPDFKFIDSKLSAEFCNSINYPETAKQNIEFMLKKKGNLKLNDNDIAVSGTLIRHLVMPNCIENSAAIIKYIVSEYGRDLYLSVMSQYSPKYKAEAIAKLNRRLYQSEYQMIIDLLESLDLENVYLQELDSNEIFFPDFETTQPFKDNSGN